MGTSGQGSNVQAQGSQLWNRGAVRDVDDRSVQSKMGAVQGLDGIFKHGQRLPQAASLDRR